MENEDRNSQKYQLCLIRCKSQIIGFYDIFLPFLLLSLEISKLYSVNLLIEQNTLELYFELVVKFDCFCYWSEAVEIELKFLV